MLCLHHFCKRYVACWCVLGLLLIETGVADSFAQPKTGKAKIDQQNESLPAGTLARIGSPNFLQPGLTEALVVSPDGKQIITLGVTVLKKAQAHGGWMASFQNPTIRLWDAATGKLLRAIPGHAPSVDGLALSADGKTLAAVSYYGGIALLDFPDGEKWRVLETTKKKKMQSVQFGANKNQLWTRADAWLSLWDVTSGKQLRGMTFGPKQKDNFPGGYDEIEGFGELSPDAKMVACPARRFEFKNGNPNEPIDKGSFVKVMNADTGELLFSTPLTTTSVQPPLFSRDSKLLAVVSNGIHVLETASGKQLFHLDGKEGYVRYPAFSPDSKKLVSIIGGGGHATCWDLATGKIIQEFFMGWEGIEIGSKSEGRALAFAPDNKTLWLGWQKAIRGWDVTTGKETVPVAAHRQAVETLTFSTDGNRLISTDPDAFGEWDPRTGKSLQFKNLHGTNPGQILGAFSVSQQSALWNAGKVGEYQIKHLFSNKSICATEPIKKDDQPWVRFRFLGKSLYAFDSNHKTDCVAWEINPVSGKKTRKIVFEEIGTGRGFNNIIAAPDGKFLASCSKDGRIILLNPETGKVLRKFAAPLCLVKKDFHHAMAYQLVLSPDGKYMACCFHEWINNLDQGDFGFNAIQVWEVASGRQMARFAVPVDIEFRFAVSGLAVAEDGRSVAFGMYGETAVRVWEVASASERGQLHGHQDIISALAFSPDGKTLASGSFDTTIVVWDLDRPFHAKGPFKAQLTDKELAAHWDTLAMLDAQKADAALWALVYAPGQSVPYLKEHLKPIKSVQDKTLEKLIADLESNIFKVRQKALVELESFQDLAEPSLRKALKGKLSVEAFQRVQSLLDKIDQPVLSAKQLQQWRALEVLERIGEGPAHELLQTLAKGAPAARCTQQAIGCLQRLEKLKK